MWNHQDVVYRVLRTAQAKSIFGISEREREVFVSTTKNVTLNNHDAASTVLLSQLAENKLEMRKRKEEVFVKKSRNNTVMSAINKTVQVIYWSTTFGQMPPLNVDPTTWPFFYAGMNCPVKCELTTDKRRVHEASALVVHARDTNEMPPQQFKDIPWILHTNENPAYTSSLHNPGIMSQFNYLASYRLDSDFPCPEFIKPYSDTPVPFSNKTGLIMFALSNCEPVRTLYVKKLMKYIQVDSYGGCLKNKDGLGGGRIAVRELQRKYKFSLTFANTDCDYYMTEKIHSALSAGSVPVWMGTDKIDEVLQWGNLNHSVIKVKDFSSPQKLAEYLHFLAGNETEYNKYLKWKYEGFKFPDEYYKSPIGQWWDGLPLYCRVCMRLAKDPKGHNGLPVDRCDGNQSRTVEKWLGTNGS